MKKSVSESIEIIKAKQQLGKKIKSLRESQKETISLRKLAGLVNLPPSNMKYIEDGVNAPTAEVYDAIIRNLRPKDKLHDEMDRLYTLIRETPPPDVCNIILRQKGMNDTLRIIEGQELSVQQIEDLQKLLTSFITEPARGESQNG